MYLFLSTATAQYEKNITVIVSRSYIKTLLMKMADSRRQTPSRCHAGPQIFKKSRRLRAYTTNMQDLRYRHLNHITPTAIFTMGFYINVLGIHNLL